MGEPLDVVPAQQYERDIVRLAREAADLRSALRNACGHMADAASLITPGMKAGTSEAKALLLSGHALAKEALK